jgi:hypothetical protein
MLVALPLLDGDTFMSDNSKLEYWERCPQSWYYAAVRRIIPAATSSPLKFGEAIHLALQCRFQLCGSGPVPPEVERRQLAILEGFWKDWSTPIGDHRTLGMACQVIKEYNRQWGADPTLDILEGGVEIPFSVPLGTIEVHGKLYKIVWIGRIDMLVKDEARRICVVDHKTSKIGGEYALQGYQNSGQLKGYCYAYAHKFGEPCYHGTVDLLVIRPPAKKKGKGNEYIRKTFSFEPEHLEEWRVDTLNTIRTMFLTHESGVFPHHTKNCIDKFGICSYFSVCTMVPLARENSLQSGEFKQDDWSPLHETNKIYAKVMALPVEALHPQEHEVEGAFNVGPAIADLVDIG